MTFNSKKSQGAQLGLNLIKFMILFFSFPADEQSMECRLNNLLNESDSESEEIGRGKRKIKPTRKVVDDDDADFSIEDLSKKAFFLF